MTKNLERLLNEDLMARFLELVMAAPEVKPLLSSEHCSVDGTMLRAWASHSSLERIDGSDDDPPLPNGGNGFGAPPAKGKKRAKGDFRGLLLSNQTHRSNSDAEARLFRKSGGTGAYLSYLGHCLMENRHGLVVVREVTPADGYSDRGAAVWMARSLPGAHQETLGADKGYDTRDFVADLRISGITPHVVAQNIQPRRRSVIDGCAVRHPGYGQSIQARRGIEQVFGWIKQSAGLRQLKARGRHGWQRCSGCMWWPTTCSAWPSYSARRSYLRERATRGGRSQSSLCRPVPISGNRAGRRPIRRPGISSEQVDADRER